MLFKEFGKPDRPVIVLLHGGGLSWWSMEEAIGRLSGEYRVVAPVIDGHGEDGAEAFRSIEDSAGKLIAYVDSRCGGKVLMLSGLSLGAQIAVEALSARPGIARYAVLESALVLPMKALTTAMAPAYKLSYGLIRQRWFARAQAKALGLPDGMFERYYQDSLRFSRQTLSNIAVSNGNYALKPSFSGVQAKVLVIVGEREIRAMRSSARKLHEAARGSQLYVAKGMRHGELSLGHPAEYVKLLEEFFAEQ